MNKFIAILLSLFLPAAASAQMYPLLIGSYTGPGKGKGIYTAIFDSQNGTLVPTFKYATIDNPSYIALSKTNDLVYSVNESGDESGVSSYRFDNESALIFLSNRISMPAMDPCYIVASNKHIITANYSSGDISVFPIAENGNIKEMSQLIKHEGSSIHATRQGKPHPHMILFTPDQKHILVSDLGTDKIMMYAYNEDSAQPLNFIRSIEVPKGAGPRHMAFSYDYSTLFVLGELDGNIHSYDFKDQHLTYKNAVNLIYPSRDVTDFGAADIHMSHDGKFLYASVRAKENLISVFEIKADNNLHAVQNFKTGGMGPRNFTISPDGAWILVAHQNSHDVTIFKRDEETGKLSESGNFINISAPVNLTFVY